MQKVYLPILLAFLISRMSSTTLCQGCKPDIRFHDDDVLYEPAQQTIYCRIRGQTVCINNMAYILYQKYFDAQWSTVATLNISEHLTTPELPNGYSLANRCSAVNISNEYRLSINPTKIDDSGNWRCVVQKYDGDLHESDIGEVKIAKKIHLEDIIIAKPPEIVLGSASSYSCRSDGVYPKATVEWNINEHSESGSTQFIPNGIAFDIISSVNYTFTNRNTIDVKCEFDREDLSLPLVAVADDVADVFDPPVVPNSSVPVEGFIGDKITLNCHVDCAMPEALTYLWMREDNQEDIGENTSSIVITVTEEYFNATIRCTVNNDVGTNLIRFTLSEKEPTTMETSTPTLAISSVPISKESPGNNSDLDTGAKLGIGLSVGVILFGIIISSFVFYNRTGCYKKQRTSLQHNAYENEDITLDDHTDVTPYEQVNGIGYEPDYPTSYVDAKPQQSYVNVKSPSYANINPTSYVNVNAMEPSKYEQLKQKNSGNIEISTYEDLNGKAK